MAFDTVIIQPDTRGYVPGVDFIAVRIGLWRIRGERQWVVGFEDAEGWYWYQNMTADAAFEFARRCIEASDT